MTIFYLPDLGEGLAEAMIQEWFIHIQDEIHTDQLIASVETAKAIVDIPSPFSGKVIKLFASPGETLKVGAPLIEIQAHDAQVLQNPSVSSYSTTVAGQLETSDIILEEENFEEDKSGHTSGVTDLPIDNLTRKSDKSGMFYSDSDSNPWQHHAEKLSGIRLSMSKNMQKVHQAVVKASIFDQADVSHWPEKTDITVNIIRAICNACQTVPDLNAWFDGHIQKRLLHTSVHLGLALDTPHGLLAPVIKDAHEKSEEKLRQMIQQFKLKYDKLSPAFFQGATILFSNIGNYAGLFSTPIVIPPTVAIIAAGKITERESKKFLPLSLSFDHRVVTGGEAARFLQALLKNIALSCYT